MTNFLLNKEETTNLFGNNLSDIKQKQLLEKVNSRFQYIIKASSEIIGRNWSWCDFTTDSGESNRGYFCKETYRKEIEFIGQCSILKNYGFDKYDNEVPTEWLWTNFEDNLKKEVANFENNNVNKNLKNLKR